MCSGGNEKILTVIPARFASTRFRGKIIAPLAGKPLVAHAYERACQAKLVSEAIVATDDQRVVTALEPLGIPVVMTTQGLPSGTDRIAEVARDSDAQIIVNVQGDEPNIDPNTIDDAIRPPLEKLEQLRALENGYPIAVVETEYEGIGVDTPEDLERVRKAFEQREEGRS